MFVKKYLDRFSKQFNLICYSRYRKINLFAEPKLTAGTNITTFTTNFGTFGLITCMDILYYNPSQSILKDTGVDTVIYSAAWNSIVPFYMCKF